MRKLIEATRKSLIICDNVKCDYDIPYSEEGDRNMMSHINKPCPLCGENLLTEKGYIINKKFMYVIAWLNRWFSWVTFFYAKGGKTETVSVHVHNGINVKKEIA